LEEGLVEILWKRLAKETDWTSVQEVEKIVEGRLMPPFTISKS